MTKNLRGEEEEEGEQYTEKDVHIPKEATKDESLAKALIGTPIIRHFKADDVAVGKVVGYYVFGEEDPKILQGYIVHTIKYEAEDLIETHAQDDYTLQQVLKQHRLFNEKEGDIPGPINFKMPEAGTTRNEIAVKKIKTYGPQILKTMMIPTSLKKYNVILYRNNKTIRAQVTERMINSVGNEIWKLKPTNTTEQLEEWVDTAQLLKYIKNAKSVGNQSFPNKRLPEMTAMKNYMPDTSEGWSFEQIGLEEDMQLSACQIVLKNQKKNGSTNKRTYEVIIQAEMNGIETCEHRPEPQFWARLVADPSTSIIFTAEKDAVDAVQAHDLLSIQKGKTPYFRRYLDKSPNMQSIEPTEGDFVQDSVFEQSSWINSLNVLENVAFGGIDYKVLKAGVKVSATTIYENTEARVRRCFAHLLEQRENQSHRTIPMLMEVFWGLIRGPKNKSNKVNFNELVNKRCKLFEEGNWKELWKHLTFKKGKQTEAPRETESD
eukprot:CAMPEP_0114342222 /NCGR_PEP_ID=MMETSP0101-20121206/9633_1 /TAXON_ID=38822 ORGANISM="Pteridomonas danica, Strain PT" /NCGR_SAMPLE_ID=MMETSP0101 /ASSEMBLY_ACC=CAM_ASM_000211 /LENGTH=489 /DNA_ID=CAMNT_0001476213 /DNA_START=404 /DNA_END=1871 /DNA_ORIENTATION=+